MFTFRCTPPFPSSSVPTRIVTGRSCAANGAAAIKQSKRTNFRLRAVALALRVRRLSIESTHRCEFVQKLDVPAHSAIDTLNLRILRLDQIVLVRRVRPTAMAKAELDCRKLQWLT